MELPPGKGERKKEKGNQEKAADSFEQAADQYRRSTLNYAVVRAKAKKMKGWHMPEPDAPRNLKRVWVGVSP